MTQSSPEIYPVLRYRNGREAIAWLGTAFGFQSHFTAPGKDDAIVHAELSLGSGMVMLASGGKPDPANPWSAEQAGIYVVVQEVDEHYARAKAAGAEIVMPLADSNHGSREYSVRDLEGHLWCFGTYRP